MEELNKIENVLQLAIQLNLNLQSCNEELRKGHFQNKMGLMIKELLKIQEVILVNPLKKLNFTSVSNWIEKYISEDEKFSQSLIGNQLRQLSKKLVNY